ncbi:MAG: T9SS type A sorting domain-containing protein [Bacteroidota bacterium]
MKNYYPISASWLLVILTSISFFPSIQAQTVRLDSSYTYSILSPTDSIPIGKTVCSYSNYRGNDECYNFSSCESFSWSFQSNRWLSETKEEMRIENDKFTRVRINYEWNAPKRKWLPISKNVTYSPNNFYANYRYVYDGEAEEWVNVDYFIDRSSNGQSSYESKSTDFVERTVSGRRYTSVNNDICQRAEEIEESWDDTLNEWLQSSRTLFTYTTTGNIFTRTTYYWRNDTEDWELETFAQTNYDSQGRRQSEVYQNFRDFFDGLTEFTYDSLGNQIERVESRRFNPLAELTFFSKRNWILDENSQQIGSASYRWENNNWALDSYSNVLRDANNRDSLFEAFQWFPDSASFVLSWSERLFYDQFDRIIDRQSLYFNTFDKRTYGFRSQAEYDTQGRRIKDIYSDYSNELMDYIPQNRYDRGYNLSGQTSMRAQYRWDIDKGDWMGTGKTTFSYVASGNHRREGYFSWDVNLNEFTLAESKVYQWGVCSEDNIVSKDKDKFRIFPNPVFDNYLHIFSDVKPYSYELLSIDGRMITKGESENNLEQLEVSGVQNGVYLLKFQFLDDSYVKKVIINHP